jgi:hypothetical protein
VRSYNRDALETVIWWLLLSVPIIVILLAVLIG